MVGPMSEGKGEWQSVVNVCWWQQILFYVICPRAKHWFNGVFGVHPSSPRARGAVAQPSVGLPHIDGKNIHLLCGAKVSTKIGGGWE